MVNVFLPMLLIGAGALALGNKKQPFRCPQLNVDGGQLEGINYLEVVTGGANKNEKLPMIIVFHGLGDTGANFIKFFMYFDVPARLIFPNGIHRWKNNYAWFQLRSLTEKQDELAEQMAHTASAVSPFIRAISRCRPTIGKPIITGHSQGGMMTLVTATRHRNLVRAAVPVSAWLPQSLWSPSIATTYAIHGTADKTIPYQRSANYYQIMISQGAPINLTPIEGRGHGIGGATQERWLQTLAYLTQPQA